MTNIQNKEKITCPICEEGHLLPNTRSETFAHNKREFTLSDLEISICDTCDSDIVTPNQFKRNQLRIVDEKRKIDGLLASADISRIRGRFNLTQQDASVIFGGGQNAFSKYERGEVIQSLSMDRLLRLVDICPTNITRLTSIAGIKPKRARAFKVICDYDQPCDSMNEKPTADVVKVESKREIKDKREQSNENWEDMVNAP